MTDALDAVAEFRTAGFHVVENLTESDGFAQHRLTILGAAWSTCIVQLSDPTTRKLGLEWLRGPGRQGLNDLMELLGKYIGEGVDSTQVRPRIIHD